MEKVFPEFSSFQAATSAILTTTLASVQAEQQEGKIVLMDQAAQMALAQDRAKLAIASRIVAWLSKGLIATPIGKVDYVDMLEETALRSKEMEIRQNAWNAILAKYTGHKIAFEAKLLRNTGFVGSALRLLPGFHPELFVHRHDHNDTSDPDLEVVTIPFDWRLKVDPATDRLVDDANEPYSQSRVPQRGSEITMTLKSGINF